MLFLTFFITPGSVEALVRWCGKIKYLLIAYFLSNICAKNYQSRFVYVRVMVRQSTDIYIETQCILQSEDLHPVSRVWNNWTCFENIDWLIILLPTVSLISPSRKFCLRLCVMHFPAILSNYNGTTAYICRRFIPTTAFLVFIFKRGFLLFFCFCSLLYARLATRQVYGATLSGPWLSLSIPFALPTF